MAYIGKKPSDTFRGLAIKDSFTGDGSTVAFDLTREAPDGGDTDLEVFIDNVRQEGGTGKAYTLGVDGSGDNKRITFTAAPDSGADIYVLNPGRDSGVIQVGDATITESKLHPDLVLGGEVATQGDVYKHYNTITADATTTMVATKNYFMMGPITVEDTKTWTIAGDGELVIL